MRRCVVPIKIGARTLIKILAVGNKLETIPTAFILDQDASLSLWLDYWRGPGVQRALKAWRNAERRAKISIKANGGFTLLIAENDNQLWWLLKRNSEIVGVGHMKITSSGFHESAAAILDSSLRGRGLYPKILRAVRTETRTRVYSDTYFLGVSAIKAWKRMGTFDPDEGRFLLQKRNNPPQRFFTTSPFDARALAGAFTVLAT